MNGGKDEARVSALSRPRGSVPSRASASARGDLAAATTRDVRVACVRACVEPGSARVRVRARDAARRCTRTLTSSGPAVPAVENISADECVVSKEKSNSSKIFFSDIHSSDRTSRGRTVAPRPLPPSPTRHVSAAPGPGWRRSRARLCDPGGPATSTATSEGSPESSRGSDSRSTSTRTPRATGTRWRCSRRCTTPSSGSPATSPGLSATKGTTCTPRRTRGSSSTRGRHFERASGIIRR